MDKDDKMNPTPPKLSDPDSWTAFGNLSYWTREPNKVIADKQGRVWLTSHDGADFFSLSAKEALQLTQFLVERFGLVVLNEPEDFGNEPSRCDCEQVPAHVICGGCGEALHSTNAMGKRAEWESGRVLDASMERS